MLERLHANLLRQEKALGYLNTLLEEEFSQLAGRDPEGVVSSEFCIHELLRQIADERMELKRLSAEAVPGVKNINQLLAALEPETAKPLAETFKKADALEQRAAVIAERNAYLARGLMEQSRSMLEFLHKQVQPKNANTYGLGGRLSNHRPQAAIMSGRT
jgi:flagellar biosynthesis/type III secretory pathway chaperone